jgi:hypothetical protein
LKDTLKLTSYEIKKEIKTDSELKEYYFQAVSNSSWANYGYLVAFEVGDNLIFFAVNNFSTISIRLPYSSFILHSLSIVLKSKFFNFA